MQQKGFTLIELMVCVAIIGILAGFGYLKFNDIIAKARCSEVISVFASYERMREASSQESGKVGATLPELGLVLKSRFFEYSDEIVITQASIFVHSGTASNGTDKVTICHRPPGNPNNFQIIKIGTPAYDAHIAHGDQACDETTGQPIIVTPSDPENPIIPDGSDNPTTPPTSQSGGSGASISSNSGGNNSSMTNSSSTAVASSVKASSNANGSSASNSNPQNNNPSSSPSNGTQSNSSNATPSDYNIILKAVAKRYIGSKCTEGMGVYTFCQPNSTVHGNIGNGTCSFYMPRF